jgi:prefoldin subunit 1
MEDNLKRQEKELTDEISSLNKKVRPYHFWWDYLTSSQSKYLEKQFNEAQAQLRDIVRSHPDSANARDLLTRKQSVPPCTQVTRF